MISLGLQLYSLRSIAEKDLEKVLKLAAELGFKGVEPAGFFNLDARRVRAICDEYDLEIPSSHSPWIRTVDDIGQAVEIANILETEYLCTGFMEDAFTDLETTVKTALLLRDLSEFAKKEGKRLFLHNHWWEFNVEGDFIPYDILAEEAPLLELELDVYWASNFGKFNPAEIVKKYQNRIPFLHLKDGPLQRDQSMMALGSGALDIPSIISACDEEITKYIIVELDTCETDMVEALRSSVNYMIENRLAVGRGV